MNEGWVKIHRKVFDNPIVCKDAEVFAIWMYLLLNATHTEYDVLFKGKRITLQKGQLVTGIISIAKKLKVDKNKVQRTLKMFENEKQIEQQTSNKNRLISIVSWEEYQESDKQNDKQVINNRETTDKQVITNKNVKNIKNEINNIYIPASENSSADTAKANKDIKHKYGEYKNVLLKDKELQTLKDQNENWEELITYLDEYIEMKGYKVKSHYLAINKWVKDAVNKQSNNKKTGVSQEWLDNWLKEG